MIDAANNLDRILIVRLSAMGDTVHTLPLAAALKKLFPGCFLGWVVEKPSAALVVGNPLVDWARVLPRGWLKSPSLVWRLRRDLRARRFDAAFDVQGLTKSAAAAFLSGAHLRVGFTRGEGRELAPLLDNLRVRPEGAHAVDRTLSLLSGIGCEAIGPVEFVFPPCPEPDRPLIEEAVSSAGGDGFILMGPWGSFPSKLWPLDRFAALAGRLRAGTGLRSLMLGHGGREREAVAALAAANPDCLSAAPDLSLVGVAELAGRARLFVGCDSFPMHAAAAAGCPALGLFGVTNPERLGPYGPAGRSLFARLTLPGSTRARRRLPPDNMFALSVDRVAEECLGMLAPPGSAPGSLFFAPSGK